MPETLSFTSLPTMGAALANGLFVGLTTNPEGLHQAVVLLPARPDKRLTWTDAKAWAESAGGVLPSRPEFAMAFANVRKDIATEGWFWTRDDVIDPDEPDNEDYASYAWLQTFYSGYQDDSLKSYEGCAVAVRLIPLTA